MRALRLLPSLLLALVCGLALAEGPAELVGNIAEVAAAQKLEQLGKEAVPALVEGLAASEHKDVILNILGNIAEPGSLPAILKYTQDPVIEYRMAACYALRNFGAPEAVLAAAKLLGDTSDRVRIAALYTLLARNASAQAPAISKLLADPDWPVRKEAARVLGELKSKDAVTNLVQRLSLELIEKKPTEGKPKGDKPELVPKYEEPVPAVRMECISSLGKIGVPGAVEGYIPLFAHGTGAEREAAIDAVERIGTGCADTLHGRNKYELKSLGRDSSEAIKNVYLSVALARLGDERAVSPAIDLLPLADTFAQIELIRFLGKRKSAKAAPSLARMLKSSGVKQVHEALAESLKSIGKPASDALLELLPDRSVCVEAMKLLEAPELHAPTAVPQFLKHLEDEDHDIRLAAVGALVAHKAEEAVPALQSVLVLDPDERVREAVADALKAITGKDYRK